MSCPIRLSAGVPTCRDCGVVLGAARGFCPREREAYGLSAHFILGSAGPVSSPGAAVAGGVSSPSPGLAGPRPHAAPPVASTFEGSSGHPPRAPP